MLGARNLAVLCIVAVAASPAAGQPVAEMEIIESNGDWDLRVSVDSFTDEETCVITYDDNVAIQGSSDSLFLSFQGQGGVQGYRYRLNDEPESGLNLSSDLERDMQVVILDGAIYDEILAADRLRVQVLTHRSSTVNEDISMNGFQETRGSYMNRCED